MIINFNIIFLNCWQMVNTMRYFDNFWLYFQRLGGLLKIWGFKYMNMQMLFQIIETKSFFFFFFANTILEFKKEGGAKRKIGGKYTQMKDSCKNSSETAGITPPGQSMLLSNRNSLGWAHPGSVKELGPSMSALKVLNWLKILLCVNLYLFFKPRKKE